MILKPNQDIKGMKLLYKSTFCSLMILILGALGFTSCSQTEMSSLSNDISENNYSVTLSPSAKDNIFGVSNAGIELKLAKVHVVAFSSDNGDFYDIANVKGLTYNSNTQSYTLSFSFRVPKDTRKTDLIFFANCNIPSRGTLERLTKDRLIETLEFETVQEDGTMIWNFNHSVAHLGIPMFGELSNFDLSKIPNTIKGGNVEMTRALARMDFGFNYTVDNNGQESSKPGINLDSEYKIASVHVYNYLDKGLVAGTSNVLSIPESAREVRKPYVYQLPTPSSLPIKQKVYLPENVGGLYSRDEVKENATSFVLGLYSPDKFAETVGHVRYFRCDLLEGDFENGGVIKDIHRNKRYVISVDEVRGEGSDDPDDAHKRAPNIKTLVTIKDWEGDITEDVEGFGEVYSHKFMISSRSIELNSNSAAPGIIDFASSFTTPLKIEADDNLSLTIVNNPDLSGLPTSPPGANAWMQYDLKVRYNIEVRLKEPIAQDQTYTFTILWDRFKIPVKVFAKSN